MAVPHGRVKGISQSVAAFVRLDRAVPFDAPDGKPVNLMLFLMAPENAAQQHLDILAELAELLSDDALRARLLLETDPLVVHKLLTSSRPSND